MSGLGIAVGIALAAATTAPKPEPWKPLRSAAATATSFLQSDWNRYQENYHPSYVLDGNPATAWVEGAAGQGEGESLTLPVSPLARARAVRLRIWNGYQKSKELWAKNSMPRAVRVALLDAAGDEVVAREHELARAFGPQAVTVDVPAGRGLAAVRLTIVSVYPGTKYKDTCISDVMVDVDSDVPYNQAAESAKLKELVRWVEERRQVAAYFAARPPEFPFAFTQYAGAPAALDAALAERRYGEREAMAKTLAGARYKAIVKTPIRAAPDGLGDRELHLEDFLQLIKLDHASLFETGDAVASHRKLEDGQDEQWLTSARVARAAGGRVAAMQFGFKEVMTERSTWTEERDLLLVYDDGGRLTTVYRDSKSSGDDPESDDELVELHEIFQLAYDGAGKVVSVERVAHRWRRAAGGKKLKPDKAATRVVYAGAREAQK